MNENLYVSVLDRSDCTFQFFFGARGIGKSYSIYDAIRKDGELYQGAHKWLYTRLTDAEIQGVSGDLNCFGEYNLKENVDIRLEYNKSISRIIRYTPYKSKDGDYEETVIGYAKSIDNFMNLRGVSLADVDYIIFDEFIPEITSRNKPIYKVAGKVFQNMYESINRNREIDGKPPVRVYFLGNPNRIDGSVTQQYKLLPIINKMLRDGIKRFTDRKRSLYIEFLEADVSKLKKNTAIYQFSGDDEFSRMALANMFPRETFNYINPNVKIIEYNPIIQYEEYSIWTHKSTGDWHVCKRTSSAKISFNDDTKRQFNKRFYSDYMMRLCDNRITFDSLDTKYWLDSTLSRK